MLNPFLLFGISNHFLHKKRLKTFEYFLFLVIFYSYSPFFNENYPYDQQISSILSLNDEFLRFFLFFHSPLSIPLPLISKLKFSVIRSIQKSPYQSDLQVELNYGIRSLQDSSTRSHSIEKESGDTADAPVQVLFERVFLVYHRDKP